jgi:ATP adenylyltransferase
MDQLYTPWRMAYIRGEKTPIDGCVFCNAQTEGDDNALVVARSEHVFAILNHYPYSSGHLMIVPYEHVPSQETFTPEMLLDVMLTTNRALASLRKLYHPHGFNLGVNIGQAAGAGIAEHYHFHVVPRWNGETGFMTPIANARVIPDTLENTHRELKQVWNELFEKEQADAKR